MSSRTSFEDEYEGEEFDLGGVISGLLGEGEFEDEFEGEDEYEDEFEFEDEWEGSPRKRRWPTRCAACTRTR